MKTRVHDVLSPWPDAQARVRGHAGGQRHDRSTLTLVLADTLPSQAMLALVQMACRGDDFAVGIHLDPPPDPRLASIATARASRSTPWGAAVRSTPATETAAALDAALSMYATLLRQRSPLCWRALDALASHGTATAAAAALGCSQQAVSAHLKRSNAAATDRIALVVQQLLDGR